MIKWVTYTIVLTLFGVDYAFGQNIIRSAYVGARNVALGNADMSEPYDMTSMYEDPATIAFLKHPSVIVNNIEGNYHEMQQNIAFPLIYDRSQMLAFGAEFYSVGELTSSQYTKRYAVGYDLAFASRLSSTVGVGARVAFRRGYVAHMPRAMAASYALGLEYAPNADMSYGLSLSGLGTGLDFTSLNSIVTPTHTVLPRVLEIGAVMRLPSEQTLQPVDLVVALSSEKILGTPGVGYMGGVEYYPFQFLALRFGYVAGSVMRGPRYGLGFRVGMIHLDLAAYPVNEGSSKVIFNQISASCEF